MPWLLEMAEETRASKTRAAMMSGSVGCCQGVNIWGLKLLLITALVVLSGCRYANGMRVVGDCSFPAESLNKVRTGISRSTALELLGLAAEVRSGDGMEILEGELWFQELPRCSD